MTATGEANDDTATTGRRLGAMGGRSLRGARSRWASRPSDRRRRRRRRRRPKPNILFIMGDDIGWMQPSIYHRGLMVGETPNIDRLGAGRRDVHRLLRRAELHRRAQRLLHRHAPAAHRHDPAAAARQPVLPAARHPGDRLVPARPRLQHRRVRQEPPRRPHRRAADRARLPRVLGLPLPPRRDAGGELPRHQQDPDRADRRAGLPQHADPRAAGGPGGGRSADHALPDAAAAGALRASPPTAPRRTRPAPTRGR